MRIARIRIRNYRSIKSLEFRPGNICSLVGENGVGKTNILSALDFVLGERWPQSRYLDKSDYFDHDENRPIFIGIEFESNEHGIWKVVFDQTLDKSPTRYYSFGSNHPQYLNNETRDKCALVYLSAERDIDRHLGPSPWTLFGRIIRQFDSDFPQDRKDALSAGFSDIEDLLRTKQFQAFEQELSTAFSGQVRQVDQTLGLRFRAFDPLGYYRSLHLLLYRGEDTQEVHLSEVGQGMRNFALLALFRAYAKVFRGDGIIAVEEPEIYLHPHAQRSLAALFRSLAAQGSQIFYSTHSANFIDTEHFDQICIIERKPDDEEEMCSCLTQVSADALLEKRRNLHPTIPMAIQGIRERYRKHCGPQHSEAFFARKIILVEGETEEFSLPVYATALDFNFDTFGVSVINCRGKNNIDWFYHLYSSFGKTTYVVFDNDRGTKNQDNLRWNRLLLTMLEQEPVELPDGTVSNTFAIMDGNFEAELERALGERYQHLKNEVREELGSTGKDLAARYIAQRLVEEGSIPPFIEQIVMAVKNLGTLQETALDDIPF